MMNYTRKRPRTTTMVDPRSGSKNQDLPSPASPHHHGVESAGSSSKALAWRTSLFLPALLLLIPSVSASSNVDSGMLEFPHIFTTNLKNLSPSDGNSRTIFKVADILQPRHPCRKLTENSCTIHLLVDSESELKQLRESFPQLQFQQVMVLEAEQQRSLKTTKKNASPQRNQTETSSRRYLQQQSSYPSISGYPCYLNLQGSYQWMQDFVQSTNQVDGLSASLINIGPSHLKSTTSSNEGYYLQVLTLTGQSTSTSITRKGILFAMAGLHPRELAPPQVLIEWLTQLVQDYSSGENAAITSLLDHEVEIHVLIQANPDGRALAETTQPWRRKNVNHLGTSAKCGADEIGIDLNRNFPFKFGLDSGSSNLPCSETFRGSGPASEVETKTIIQYLQSIFPDWQQGQESSVLQGIPFPTNHTGVFIDLHAYGNVMIWPWGYVNRKNPNFLENEAFMNKLSKFNSLGLAGPGPTTYFGEASGASDDFCYASLGVASMTWELGEQAFAQACDRFEAWLPNYLDGLTYAAQVSQAPFALSQGPDVVQVDIELIIDDSSVVISVTASDSEASINANHPTAQDDVVAIYFYLDVHPFDEDSNARPFAVLAESDGELQNGQGQIQFFIVEQSGQDGETTYQLDPYDYFIPTLQSKHMLFIQAKDSAGFRGPVRAEWLDLTVLLSDDDSSAAAEDDTTEGPSIAPSVMPTLVPTPSGPSLAPSFAFSDMPSATPDGSFGTALMLPKLAMLGAAMLL